jgi:hypothetical protein
MVGQTIGWRDLPRPRASIIAQHRTYYTQPRSLLLYERGTKAKLGTEPTRQIGVPRVRLVMRRLRCVHLFSMLSTCLIALRDREPKGALREPDV